MTNQEIAQALAEIPLNELAEATDEIFDRWFDEITEQKRKEVYDILYQQGVDIGPICKRKHPA